MKEKMCIDSASPDPSTGSGSALSKVERADNERMLEYKKLAIAFSYPDDSFFAFFPQISQEPEALRLEYDRLFRSSEVWLYGSEHTAENEFQRAQNLADINGFYRAFGLEPDKDRPDALSCELEFMHYLIFKKLHALKDKNKPGNRAKASTCLGAEKKFFSEHLYPAAKSIARKITSQAKDGFYLAASQELLKFLEAEEEGLFKKDR